MYGDTLTENKLSFVSIRRKNDLFKNQTVIEQCERCEEDIAGGRCVFCDGLTKEEFLESLKVVV